MSIVPDPNCIVCGYKILNTTIICPACGAEQSDSDTSTSTSMDTSADSASSSNLKNTLRRYFNDNIPPGEIIISSSEQSMLFPRGPTGVMGPAGPVILPRGPTGPSGQSCSNNQDESTPTKVLSGNGPPSIPPQNNGDIYIDLNDYTHYVVIRGEWILKEMD